MNALFVLETYTGRSSRHPCPACKQEHQLVRYINQRTGHYLADHVGRCNRENKCGYHYKPADYFRDNPDKSTNTSTRPTTTTIPREWVKKSWCDYETNHFVMWLCDLFQMEMAMDLVNRFKIGSSRRWPGATVFWQIDRENNVRSGKIMGYDPKTGKRTKDQNGKPRIDWVHSILTRKKLLSGFQLNQCFFGEHQLKLESLDKPIAIVESEKTAIIASAFLPNFIWLSAGQMNGLAVRKFRPLAGREIVLYPDLGIDKGLGTPFQKWQQQSDEIQEKIGGRITVSDILERYVTNPIERENGCDLADYLIKTDPEYGWALKDGYPAFWDTVPDDPNYDDDYIQRLL